MCKIQQVIIRSENTLDRLLREVECFHIANNCSQNWSIRSRIYALNIHQIFLGTCLFNNENKLLSNFQIIYWSARCTFDRFSNMNSWSNIASILLIFIITVITEIFYWLLFSRILRSYCGITYIIELFWC